MQYAVYILTNRTSQVLYVGVTNNLQRRMFEHREHLVEGFTKRYKVTKLVYYELHSDVREAISREKQLKAGTRKKKEELIVRLNPTWDDLYQTIL